MRDRTMSLAIEEKNPMHIEDSEQTQWRLFLIDKLLVSSSLGGGSLIPQHLGCCFWAFLNDTFVVFIN